MDKPGIGIILIGWLEILYGIYVFLMAMIPAVSDYRHISENTIYAALLAAFFIGTGVLVLKLNPNGRMMSLLLAVAGVVIGTVSTPYLRSEAAAHYTTKVLYFIFGAFCLIYLNNGKVKRLFEKG